MSSENKSILSHLNSHIKIASAIGLNITPENSKKIQYKLLRYFWYTISLSMLPLIVSIV